MSNCTFKANLPPEVAALLLEAVYAGAPVGLCFVDSDLRFVTVNEHLAAINGLPVEAHIGRKIVDVLGDLGRFLQDVHRGVLNTGTPIVDLEIGGDGRGPPWEGRSWLASYFPLRSAAGSVVGVNGVIKEITQQKTTERALRAAREAATNAVERLSFALEMAEAAEWEMDCRTGIARWSPQMYTLYGLPPETTPSSAAFLTLLSAEDREMWQAAKAKVFAERNQEFRQSFRILHPSKGLRWISSRAYIEYSDSGLPERIGGIKIDITELKKVQADLEKAKEEADRANEAKSKFLAAASHDLRQPLQALSLYLGVLEGRATEGDGPVFQHIDSCLSNLNELLRDLLDLSKLDAGVVNLEVTDFAIAQLLNKIASSRLPEAGERHLRLRVLPTGLVARTDPILLERLLGNLVDNAVRYTDHGGIVIGCRRRQGKIWIEVWDTGIGIPKDKTGAIFEPFTQLGNPERSREKGSGLGLAIVTKIAALLGLDIRVSSTPGKGSMFAVEIPLGEAPAAVAPVMARVAKKSLRIALVEDDGSVRDATAFALEEMGHQVVVAATIRDLVRRLKKQAPDMIIADYRLNGQETGFDAIATVRTAFPESIPAVVFTGDTDPEIVRELIGRGVRVLHKPLSFDDLEHCVAGLMEDRPGFAR